MYTLNIKFNLLNKTYKKDRLKCINNSDKMQISPDNPSPFSIIISGFSNERAAQEVVNQIRISNINIPKFDKNSCIFKLSDDTPNDMISVENTDISNSYSINITDFKSIKEAKTAIAQVEKAFTKYMLIFQCAFEANFGNPLIINDNQRICSTNGAPLIFKTERKAPLSRIEGSNVTSDTQTPSSSLIGMIEEALLENKLLDDKTKLAFDIYRMSFFDDNRNSRFLNLVNILEVLSVKKTKHIKVIALIDKWKDECKNLSKTEQEENYITSLSDLSKALDFTKEQSIRSSIYDLVKNELDHIDKAKAAKAWYDIRSTLVHQGIYDDKKANQIHYPIETIVREILMKKI